MTIFLPIADFEAGVGGLQLCINTWSRVISKKNIREKVPGGHMTPPPLGSPKVKTSLPIFLQMLDLNLPIFSQYSVGASMSLLSLRKLKLLVVSREVASPKRPEFPQPVAGFPRIMG